MHTCSRFFEMVAVFLLFCLPTMLLTRLVLLLVPGYLQNAPDNLLAELSWVFLQMSNTGSAQKDDLFEYVDELCLLVYKITYLHMLLLIHPLLP